MATILIVFALAVVAYFAVDILASRWSGERETSFPSGCIVVGLICAVAAHFVAPWTAVMIFLLVAAMRVREAHLNRRSALAVDERRPTQDGP